MIPFQPQQSQCLGPVLGEGKACWYSWCGSPQRRPETRAIHSGWGCHTKVSKANISQTLVMLYGTALKDEHYLESSWNTVWLLNAKVCQIDTNMSAAWKLEITLFLHYFFLKKQNQHHNCRGIQFHKTAGSSYCLLSVANMLSEGQ